MRERQAPLDIARYHAKRGEVNVANMDLALCKDVSMPERLGILADAYDRQADSLRRMDQQADPEVRDLCLVPTWTLEEIGIRAIAKHLRELADQNTVPTSTQTTQGG